MRAGRREQVVYTREGELVDIEGNPRSPINQGTLCPKGSASRQLVHEQVMTTLLDEVHGWRDEPSGLGEPG